MWARFSTNTCIISDLEWTTSGARDVSQPQISATISFFLNDAPAEQNQTELLNPTRGSTGAGISEASP
jgi:hypothetical protein